MAASSLGSWGLVSVLCSVSTLTLLRGLGNMTLGQARTCSLFLTAGH